MAYDMQGTANSAWLAIPIEIGPEEHLWMLLQPGVSCDCLAQSKADECGS